MVILRTHLGILAIPRLILLTQHLELPPADSIVGNDLPADWRFDELLAAVCLSLAC
ncbi:hypothetical protein Pla22_09760 [Rubripirellula amarantea]|uniref:Uncharacterized protein n=1 Tax=Rubripirellula amarantea TaxID=2527999 RepID=A0A5C5WRZ4_9BACT|nr:hypothetical protein Pla22_09760 [Rubripirellula amarantea]